ncbi:MAG: hypothetical protein ACOYY3_03870 [Chloroflexota bacterium]
MKSLKKVFTESSILLIGTLAIVVLFWVPFGFKTPDIADGWRDYITVQDKSFVDTIRQTYRLSARPLVFVPWKLANLISPDSYLGVNILMMFVFWGKILALYFILGELKVFNRPMAFLTSILFAFYPVDQGNFLMSAFSRHFAVFFYLLAVFFMILTVKNKNIWWLTGMLLFEAISVFISEQGYPLFLITPLFLLSLRNIPNKTKAWTGALWYIILCLAIAIYLLNTKHPANTNDYQYQTLLFEESGIRGNPSQFLAETVISNLVAYRRIFFDGWQIAIKNFVNFQPLHFLFSIFTTCLSIGVAFILPKFSPEPEHEQKAIVAPTRFAVIIACIVIIGAGFSPYSITPYRFIDFRVFYYSAIGGAIITGLIYLHLFEKLIRPRKWISILPFGLIIFVISYNSFNQHSKFVHLSNIQQKVLIRIIEEAPLIKPSSTIILLTDHNDKPFINAGGFSNNDPFRSDQQFSYALMWLAKMPQARAILCDISNECAQKIKYQNAILFKFSENDGAKLLSQVPDYLPQDNSSAYKPYLRIQAYTPFPERPKNSFDFSPDPTRLLPENWSATGQSLNDRKVCNVSHSGYCAIFFSRDDTNTEFSQQISLIGQAQDSLEVSFWAKVRVPLSAKIQIAVLELYDKGGLVKAYKIFSTITTNWTLIKYSIEVEKPYSYIRIKFNPKPENRYLWIDEIRILQNEHDTPIRNPSFED